MTQRNEYALDEKIKLIEKYRKQAYMSTGSTSARKWYLRGIKYAKKGGKYDQKNYEHFYDFQEHDEGYEKKGFAFFEKAVNCFKKAAELGNDLAIMNYAVYLYSFKEDHPKALELFEKASKLGLAVADYQLWLFYKNGYCGTEKDENKADIYLEQYHKRCETDERQLILAWDLEEDEERIIGRAYMYNWFEGYSFPEVYDTPSAKPSSWKYKSWTL